jgi:SAM-dependent methyltransferase
MSTAQAGMVGEAPTVLIETPKEEPNPLQEVYERCYSEEAKEYRNFSPGETLVYHFWDAATNILGSEPYETQTLVDYGCGTGRASLTLARQGLKVTAVDFADNCLDPHVKTAIEGDFSDKLKFEVRDLTKPLPDDFKSQYGYCCDVLEHIPEEDIDAVLMNVLGHSKHCWFQISCIEDHFGGHPHIKGDNEELHLHLTVWDYNKWLKKFSDLNCVIHASWDRRSHCIFFVTATRSTHIDSKLGVVNVEPEKLLENIYENAKLNLPAISPCDTQETEVVLIAGGPSLNLFEDEIIQKRKDGMKLVTVNGSYNWALERGLEPSMQVIADSREFNERFTVQSDLTKNTIFLINSSADPSVFKNLPLDRTYMMHSTLDPEAFEAICECYGEQYVDTFPVPGGSTVTMRAMAALRMLGFYKMHVYGFDSCFMSDPGEHHAYAQPENDHDTKRAIPFTMAAGSDYERTFMMAPWHVYQLYDFMRLSRYLLKDAQVAVYGDGAIAHAINTAAALDTSDEEETEDTVQPGPIVYTLSPVPYAEIADY